MRVCITARELYGWGEVSEAGAGVIAVAQQMAADGDQVTLLWIPPHGEIEAAAAKRLKEYYLDHHLIRLEILTDSRHLMPVLWGAEKQSSAAYFYIKESDFDVVVFALEGGLGYYTILGRELGLVKPALEVRILAQAPLVWRAAANRHFLRDLSDVTIAHMERYCLEAVEEIIYVSDKLPAFLEAQGWKLPQRARVLPIVRQTEWRGVARAGETEPRAVDEIVLLAGPEYRDGLTLFCDALDKLARASTARLKVTMLGDFGKLLGEHTGGMLLRRARDWPFELILLPRLREQDFLTYLKVPGRLAVVPALDSLVPMWVTTCLEERIPFIATDVGAVAAQIAAEDRARCVCAPNPTALARRIGEIVQSRCEPGRPAQAAAEKRAAWKSYFAGLADAVEKARDRRISRSRKSAPLVSVVLVHHDRPNYLRQAVRSIEAQDYPQIELVLVDDGSSLPESHALLDELEQEFGPRGWRILREENRYLGAARNAGVRSARGDRILFVDDDNALFPEAVSTFVHAMDTSGADICTAFQKVFHSEEVPTDRARGLIHYFPPGGSLDLGFIHDSFGDANAMIRREVFDRIGYQLEDYGYTAQDWEFFSRAVMAGLKLRVIPEPLYWYRASAKGMYRNSHWYDNRLPILAAFRKNGFRGLEHIYDLVLSTFVGKSETEGLRENLSYSTSNERHIQLTKLEPNSDEALELLAEIAAMEGRADTAVAVLGRVQRPNYQQRVLERLQTRPQHAHILAELNSGFTSDEQFSEADLREFTAVSLDRLAATPLVYIEKPDRLYLEALAGDTTVAARVAAVPAGATRVRALMYLDQAISKQTEFLILVSPNHVDPRLAVRRVAALASDGSSGWCRLSHPYERREIEARLAVPLDESQSLILAVRSADSTSAVMGCFHGISTSVSLAAPGAQRPRIGPPPTRLRAREWTRDEMKSVRLVSKHRSVLPQVLISPDGKGIFLRPNAAGNVIAVLPWLFPPFARQVLARVEIAHEDASPFEFAMALSRPEVPIDWAGDEPEHHFGFSGWLKVNECFRLEELRVRVHEPLRTHLDVNLAIRLPPGSSPSPAEAYWRKLILVWDE